MKIIESYLQEGLFPTPFQYDKEYEHLRKTRKSNKYLWLYHGTDIKLWPKIKKEGLKVSSFKDRNFKYHGEIKPAIFLTPTKMASKVYASHTSLNDIENMFTKEYWVRFFKSETEQPLLCRLDTKYLDFFLTYKRFKIFGYPIHEYVYYKDIPSKDKLR